MAELGRSRIPGVFVRSVTFCKAELFRIRVIFCCLCFILAQFGKVSRQRLWIVTLHVGQLSASLAVILLLHAEQSVVPDTVNEVKR